MPLTNFGRTLGHPRSEHRAPDRHHSRRASTHPGHLAQASREQEPILAAPPSDQLPRVLAGVDGHGPLSLREHHAHHGALSPPRRQSPDSDLLDSIEMAGLLGHGGAAFPTATKMRAVASAGRRPVVVVNGSEGEPASAKDATLLEHAPHLVLDGAVLAARAVGSARVIVCVGNGSLLAQRAVSGALQERQRARIDPIEIAVVLVPDRFITGQESALISHINGGPGLPTFTPPRPFERGVARRPTLVNNAETLAHVALIARYGPQWFRGLGTTHEPGSTLVTLSGALTRPGVYEIEYGTPLSRLISAAGGSPAHARAVLLGGYFGSWLPGALAAELTLSREGLRPHGASLGAGVIAVLTNESCGVAETARVARWLAQESAGQCGPCVHGLDAMSRALDELRQGVASPQTEQRIRRWADLTTRRGACAHPDGAVRFIASALDVFADEFADHARRGPCDVCERAAQLPTPAPALRAAAA